MQESEIIAESVRGRGAKSFEELHIFRESRDLVAEIWKVSGSNAFAKDPVLVNQMRRAALSVLSNIAEGFERRSRPEFARFLVIAKGSCGELRAQLLVAIDQKYLTTDQHKKLSDRTKKISAGLYNLARYLRTSGRSQNP